MSIERRGDHWRVRWREQGQHRSQEFDRRGDAELFESELRRKKQLGKYGAFLGGHMTLDDYVQRIWRPGARGRLSERTMEDYQMLYDGLIGPTLGNTPLDSISTETIRQWQALCLDSRGPGTVEHAQRLLASILQEAAESDRIPRNPARLVKKPKVPHREIPQMPTPLTVERMRFEATYGAVTDDLGRRDALMISLFSYAGLRPEELRGLRWGDIRDGQLFVQRVLVKAGFRDTKTGQHRSIKLLDGLRSDLERAAEEEGASDASTQVIKGLEQDHFSFYAYQTWVSRAFRRYREAADAGPISPYDLRHAFASLLLYEGHSVIYVAQQLGHDARLTLKTYGHVIAGLEDTPRTPANQLIAEARRSVWGEA